MTGVLIGCYFWGKFADKHGRIKPFKTTLFISGIFGLVSSISVDFWMLVIFLFVIGLGLGGNLAVDGVFFLEYLPKNSYWLLTAMSIITVIGSIFVPAVAWLLCVINTPMMWRFLIAIVSFVIILSAIFRLK